MSEDKKKLALALRPLEKGGPSDLITAQGFDITTTPVAGNVHDLLLNLDVQENFNDIAKLYETVEKQTSILSLAKVKNLNDFFASQGRGVFLPELFESKIACKMLERFLNHHTSTSLKDIFADSFTDYKIGKITNHLQSGHYADVVAMDAFDQGHNVVLVRNFLINCIYYFSYLRTSEKCGLPIEMEYAVNADACVAQLLVPVTVKDFYLDYVLDSLDAQNSESPFKHLLYTCFQNCHLLDIQYQRSSAKLVITGLWVKNGQKEVSSSFLLNDFLTYAQAQRLEDKKFSDVTFALEKNIKELEEKLKDKLLPGDAVKNILLSSTEGIFQNNPALFNEIVLNVMDQRMAQENPKALAELLMPDLEEYLAHYPDTQLIQKMAPQEKDKILDFLKNDKALAQMLEGLQKREEAVSTTELDTSSILSTLHEELMDKYKVAPTTSASEATTVVASGPSEAEAKTVVSAGVAEEEAVTVVSGGPAEEEAVTVVNGGPTEEEAVSVVSGGENEEEAITKISGSNEPIKEAITKVNGQKEEIKEEILKIKGTPLEKQKEEKVVFKNTPNEKDEKGSFKFKSLSSGIKAEEGEVTVPSSLAQDEMEKTVVGGADGSEAQTKVTVSGGTEAPVDEGVKTFKSDSQIKAEEAIKLKSKQLDSELLTKILGLISSELAKIPKGVKLNGLSDELTQKIIDTFNIDIKIAGALVQDAIKTLQRSLAKSALNKELGQAFSANEGALKETRFLEEIKKKDTELSQVKKQIDILKGQIEAHKDSQKQLREAQNASQVALKEQEQHFREELHAVEKASKEKQDLAAEMKTGRVLTDRDADKLKRALEESINATKQAKQAGLEVKKVETAFTAQVNFLESEVRKNQKEIKNRDLIAEKLKESMNRALAMKDEKIKVQEERIAQLSDINSKQAQSSDKDKVRTLTDQLDNALKQSDLYKRKLAGVTESLNSAKNSASTEVLDKELKRVKAREEKLAQTLTAVNSEKQFLQSKLRETTVTLESKMKELKEAQAGGGKGTPGTAAASSSVGSSKDAHVLREQNVAFERNIKEMTKKLNDAQSDLKASQLKVKELEQKLKFAQASGNKDDDKEKEKANKVQTASKDDSKQVDAKTKQKMQQMEKQMELVNDKLTQATTELAEAKKASAKLKQETQAQKNEIDKLKKDLSKFQKKAA